MSVSPQARESALLVPFRRHFEQRGFDFLTQPPRELVPPFLGAYRPDAIAFDQSGGGVVIEVKTRPSPDADRSLSRIAGLFSHQRDWTFQVIYEGEVPEQGQLVEAADIDGIRAALRELDALAAGSQRRAAFLLAWSVLEAIGRRLEPTLSGENLSTRDLIEGLTAEGYLGQASARIVRDLLPLRNALAHGGLMRDVTAGDLVALLDQVRGLAALLDPDASPTP